MKPESIALSWTRRNSRSVIWIAPLLLWLACWLYFSRYQMLDDALIHWRYATKFHQLHFLSFNGDQATYGNSSLLYVHALSVLNSLFASPLTPKVLSTTVYLVLLAVVAFDILPFHGRTRTAARLCLLTCLVGPFSIRWLSDGMETSTTLLIAYLLGSAAAKCGRVRHISIYYWLGLAIMGALIGFLRIELAFPVALACIAITLDRFQISRQDSTTPARLIPLALGGSALGIGALIAMATIVFRFQHLLPDTAVAKLGRPGLTPIIGVLASIVSSYSFGIGLLILWLLTAFYSMRAIRNSGGSLLSWLAINSCWPLVVILASVRGQEIQGVRYLAWSWLFSITWNIINLDKTPSTATSKRAGKAPWMIYLLAGLFVMSWIAEAPGAIRVMNGRSKTFLEMRSLPFRQFQGQVGAASDVGFIGYFSDARICDTGGLVNGRDWAKLTSTGRQRECASKHPAFLFMTADQLVEFSQWEDLSKWSYCRYFDFTNIKSNDRHYFAVSNLDAGRVCPTLGGRAQALDSVVALSAVAGSS